MTEKKKYELIILNLKIYGVIAAVIFGLLALKKVDYLLSFVIAFSFSTFILLCVYIKDKVGIMKHKAIIDTILFIHLLDRDFKLETKNNYYGLKGTYKKAVVRIYYDWNKQAESFFSFGDLAINIYYEPIFNFALREPDFERLEELNKKFSFIKWVRKKRNFNLFSTGYFIRQINYSSKLSVDKVFNEIDLGLSEIFESGLTIIDKETFEKYETQFDEIYLPFIDTYREIA